MAARGGKAGLAGLALAALAASTAFAAERGLPSATRAIEGAATSTPIGWVEFCDRYVSDCAVPALPRQEARLTPELWRRIVTVNEAVNAAVEPLTDLEHWGVVERWDYPSDGKGDCEDYALAKRRLLIEAGVPRGALVMTVVRDRKNEGHAVLSLLTDRGDFVLDNQEGRVLAWSDTGYTFVKRQSREDPNRWVSLGGSASIPATASRR